jgi:excinuclease ABC subunit A
MEVIRSADWIIDLGPEAGDEGGNLVFAGKPGDLKKNKQSHTSSFL